MERHRATDRHHALAPQTSADTAVAGAKAPATGADKEKELDCAYAGRRGQSLNGYLPAVPVTLVARFAVEPVVVVAAARVPVVTPTSVPPISGAPVILREGCGLGVGDGCQPQSSKP